MEKSHSPSTFSPFVWGRSLLIAGMFAMGIILYPSLPDTIPTHWALDGTIDGWSSKQFGTWIAPGVALAITLLFPLLRRIDPFRDRYAQFRRALDTIQFLLVAFFAFVFILQMRSTLLPDAAGEMSRWLLVGLGLFFAIFGNVMGKIRQNYFIGVRTPWTLSNPEVWVRTHRFTGKVWVVGGLAFSVLAWLGYATNGWALAGMILLLALGPVVYSYASYRALSA